MCMYTVEMGFEYTPVIHNSSEIECHLMQYHQESLRFKNSLLLSFVPEQNRFDDIPFLHSFPRLQELLDREMLFDLLQW